MIRIIPIAGEGMDADYVSIPQYREPSYPECPVCEEESDAQGFCVDCDAFAHEHPPAVSEWQERQVPHAELKRTGTGGWFA